MSLRKYLTYMQINLQDSLVYRAEAVVWMLVEAIPAYSMLLIWTTVYQATDVIGGYNLGDMVAYYLAAVFIGVAITPHMEYSMGYEIRHGLLSQQLSKPWSLFGAWVTGETAWQVIKGATNIPLLLGMAWLFRDALQFPRIMPAQWLLFFVACALAYAINVGAKMILGTLAFWFVEPGGIIGIYDSLSWFLQGGLVPLDLLPQWLQHISAVLPFQYALAFPIRILLGQLPTSAILPGLLVQLAWASFLLGVASFCWRRGVRIYSAVGG